MLTEKEIEILTFRKSGLKQAEIAAKLKISQAAVSHFERNALNKIKDAKETLQVAKNLDLLQDK